MATAAQHLANFGVSVDVAREWIFANLGDLHLVLTVATNYGVTNAMLGEIAGGYSGAQVQAYFMAHGLDSTVLDEAEPIPDPYIGYRHMPLVTLTGVPDPQPD